MVAESALIERLRELFPGADTVRISSPCRRMFLIIGHKRNTRGDAGQWVDQDGNARDWEYVAETTVASGGTEQELLEAAERYQALSGMTWDEYFGKRPVVTGYDAETWIYSSEPGYDEEVSEESGDKGA